MTETKEKYEYVISELRNYLKKNNFSQVTLGLSGGIDSALVATISVDAVGPENVHVLLMPSQYTQEINIKDAEVLSSNLHIKYSIINIEALFQSFKNSLSDLFKNTEEDTTEENLQSRIRGVMLMAFSNKFKKLVLATANRSEIMTGYCTLYGDTCGGYAPISCFFKTEVYELAYWRNENIPSNSIYMKNNIIHKSILEKAPTAELRHNQKDSDSLPEYDVLDKVLYLILDENYNYDQLINIGYEKQLINRIEKLIETSHYKRNQLPPGPMKYLNSINQHIIKS
jgi:NAD+ synthase/NAD+ synthase (glutamine-hydrolysing)